MTLPFTDLRPNVNKLADITVGADAVELRADLLYDPHTTEQSDFRKTFRTELSDNVEAYENPSLSFLSEQVALVRRYLPKVPIVFTLRTPAQGGRFPYPADAPSSALFASLHHALKLTCDVIDIERGLDELETSRLIEEAKARHVTVMISWRDVLPPHKGGFHWSHEAAKNMYHEAASMGADIVKIVGTAGKVSDNFALRVFAADLETIRKTSEPNGLHVPPLSAYNMGYRGRISRFLNPTLASVTHSIIKKNTVQGIVGDPSMTFQETQRALHLSGLIEAWTLISINFRPSSSLAQRSEHRFRSWIHQMGLPHAFMQMDWDESHESQHDIHEMPQLHRNLSRLRSMRNLGLMIGTMECFDEIPSAWCEALQSSPERSSIETGASDLVVARRYPTTFAEDVGEVQPDSVTQSFIGSNNVSLALAELIGDLVSPSVHLSKQSSAAIIAPSFTSTLAKCAHVALTSLGLEKIRICSATDVIKDIGHIQAASVIVDATRTNILYASLTKAQHILETSGGGEIHQCLLSRTDPCSPGLVVTLFDATPQWQRLLDLHHVRSQGWRLLDSDRIWHHVDSLRFFALTGRRAPSYFATQSNDMDLSFAMTTEDELVQQVKEKLNKDV